jgi:hypothetical protein
LKPLRETKGEISIGYLERHIMTYKYYPQLMTEEQIKAELRRISRFETDPSVDIDTWCKNFDNECNVKFDKIHELEIKREYIPYNLYTLKIKSDVWTIFQSLHSYEIFRNNKLQCSYMFSSVYYYCYDSMIDDVSRVISKCYRGWRYTQAKIKDMLIFTDPQFVGDIMTA